MKYFGYFFLACFSALLFGGTADARPKGSTTAGIVVQDGGNKARLIGVRPSTITAVLISSDAAVAGLGIYEWHYREIVNCSTAARLALFFDVPGANVFIATSGVVLSSTTRTNEPCVKMDSPKNWLGTYFQGPIYGIWQPGAVESEIGFTTNTVRAGAGGYETYDKR